MDVKEKIEKIREEATAKAMKLIADAKSGVATKKAVSQGLSPQSQAVLVSSLNEIFYGLSQEFKRSSTNFVRELNSAENYELQNFSLLPNNCKYFRIDSSEDKKEKGKVLHKYGLFAIQDAPQIRTIHIDSKPIRIPFPYVVYIVSFQARIDLQKSKDPQNIDFYPNVFGVSFAKKSIQSLDDTLYSCHLPHVTGKNHVCQPYYGSTKTLGDLSSSLIDAFWNSRFVYSFNKSHWFNCGEKTVKNWKDWSDLGANPLQILQSNFSQPESLKNVLEPLFKRKSSKSVVAIENLIAEQNRLLLSGKSVKSIQDLIQQTVLKDALQS